MFIQTSPKNKDGRITMYFAESYREDGKVKQRTIERIGFIDEFTHLYKDPIAHFKKVAKERTKELKERQKPIAIELEREAILPFDEDTEAYDCVMNIGYAAISKVFHKLDIHTFLDRRRKYLDVQYNLTSVVKLLVYERILEPDSKRANWLRRNKYFEKMDFDLNSVYRSLSVLPKYRDGLLKHLHKQMVTKYDRNSTVLFYDVTNYYFEIDKEDDFRKKRPSKENRPNPIVQLGLFMDQEGFPVTYDLFEGNMNDCLTFSPMSEQVRNIIDVKHLIFIADKAMMTGDNTAEVIINHNGYIFSKSVRGATKQLKDITRDPEGYLKFDANSRLIKNTDTETPVAFKYKIFDEAKVTYVKDTEGKRKSVQGIGHYQIIYWSAKYAKKAEKDRENAVNKAKERSNTRSKAVIDNNHGSNKYLKTKVIDPKTKKEVEKYDAKVEFDEEKLEEDQSLDGFYIIETNVIGLRPKLDVKGRESGEIEDSFNKPQRWLRAEGMLQLNKIVNPLDIIDMYHGLWKIEESFKITKSDLEARPVYVSRKERIQSHFLTCFIALLILRILEKDLDHEYSSGKIKNSLKNANVVELNSTTFKTVYYDRVLQKLKYKYGINYGQNVYRRTDIKKILAETKKHP